MFIPCDGAVYCCMCILCGFFFQICGQRQWTIAVGLMRGQLMMWPHWLWMNVNQRASTTPNALLSTSILRRGILSGGAGWEHIVILLPPAGLVLRTINWIETYWVSATHIVGYVYFCSLRDIETVMACSSCHDVVRWYCNKL